MTLSAITAAVLAVLAAIGSLLSGYTVSQAILKQTQATDQWAYYVIDGLGGMAVLAPCDPGEGGLDLRVAQLGQAGPGGAVGGHGGQALLDVAAVRFQVNLGQTLQQCPLRAGQVAAGFQVVGQTAGLVERPGLEGGQELALVDDPALEASSPNRSWRSAAALAMTGSSGKGNGLKGGLVHRE